MPARSAYGGRIVGDFLCRWGYCACFFVVQPVVFFCVTVLCLSNRMVKLVCLSLLFKFGTSFHMFCDQYKKEVSF